MKPFLFGDKRYAFDVTNADDLARLERAFAGMMCAGQELTEGEASASEKMRAVFSAYQTFFETLFPGRGGEIVGDTPSAGRAVQAFERFTVYLNSSIAEANRMEQMLEALYLGKECGPASPAGAEC